MDRRSSIPVVLASILVFLVGCAKDEGPVYIPRTLVDTVHFSTEVVPIFTAHCWNCHPTMADLDLGVPYAYANLVNVTSSNHAPAIRVVPGDLDASVLWHKVSGSDTYGLNMPPSGTPLSFQELQTIHDWIEQGALNN
ncbi:MAG: hypothetical protein K8H89_01475 [Flavobacteriales bacterium]|jgi:hypothetical protein|nr:hypothetical protein [Flavobacteriales bacterium]MCB0759457.1 hypothetical protein [Flavobacteriales bacterium]